MMRASGRTAAIARAAVRDHRYCTEASPTRWSGRAAAGSCVDTVMSQSYGVLSGVIEPSTAIRDASAQAPGASRRVLVVSHPAVVTVNQEVYLELARRGWEVTLVVPRRWRHEYS